MNLSTSLMCRSLSLLEVTDDPERYMQITTWPGIALGGEAYTGHHGATHASLISRHGFNMAWKCWRFFPPGSAPVSLGGDANPGGKLGEVCWFDVRPTLEERTKVDELLDKKYGFRQILHNTLNSKDL
jgi:hypothetical protein